MNGITKVDDVKHLDGFLSGGCAEQRARAVGRHVADGRQVAAEVLHELYAFLLEPEEITFFYFGGEILMDK